MNVNEQPTPECLTRENYKKNDNQDKKCMNNLQRVAVWMWNAPSSPDGTFWAPWFIHSFGETRIPSNAQSWCNFFFFFHVGQRDEKN